MNIFDNFIIKFDVFIKYVCLKYIQMLLITTLIA